MATIPTLEEAQLLQSLEENRDLIRSYANSTKVTPLQDRFFSVYTLNTLRNVAHAEKVLSRFDNSDSLI